MSENLPALHITPTMAIRFARNNHLRVTREEATQWLIRNRKEIERRLTGSVEDAVEDVLRDVTLWEFPEPAFDRMFQLVQTAFDKAIEEREVNHKLQFSGNSFNVLDMHKVVRCFLRHKGPRPKRACLAVEISWAAADGDPTDGGPEIPFFLELIYENGKLSGRLQEDLGIEKRCVGSRNR